MKTALLRPVLLVVLAGAVTGCSRYYWSKSGATAEQFTQDNQACLQQAAGTLPSGASSEAVEQYYRACLNSRGYVRDKQLDPPPPGSYRGIESGEEFTAAVQAATVRGPRQSFEQQLAQLDELKARGRITEDEYATMRRRLVEGVTPGELRGAGQQLEWDWELVTDRVTARAGGTGSASGDRVSLVGRATGFAQGGSGTLSFALTWDGAVLLGTSPARATCPATWSSGETAPEPIDLLE